VVEGDIDNIVLDELGEQGIDSRESLAGSDNLDKVSFGARGGEVDLSNFSLQPIKDVYSQFNNGEEVWFLDESGGLVRVTGIEKVSYKGKIYDVDVENDIILVQGRSRVLDSYESSDVENDIVLVSRRNGSAVWSGNSNNGSVQGDAKQVDNGKFGKGFEFDGDGDYVDVGSDSSLENFSEMTILMWLKPTNYTGSFRAVYYAGYWTSPFGYMVVLNQNSNEFYTYLKNTSGSAVGESDTTFTPNEWVHYGFGYNGSTVTYYKNGVQSSASPDSLSGTLSNSAVNQVIGSGYASYDDFNGTIDEVLIFNRSLSASEIMGLYNASRVSYSESGLSDGSHDYTAYTQDYAANIGSEVLSFDVDTVFPSVEFGSGILSNGSQTANNWIFMNISANDTGSVSNNISAFIDYDNSLISWWRMDDVNGSGDLVDYKHCYDEETKVMTSKGWKYFKDVSLKDEILTLDGESGEKEWHKPFEKQDFDGDKEMYKIKTSEGELVVSEEHKVYSSRKSLSSGVLNTLTADFTGSSWKCSSFDQRGQLSLSANARYGASSGSDISDLAQFKYCGETFVFKLTNFDNESFFNKEKAMLASDTNFIYCPPDLLNLSLTRLANLKQSSSVILLSLVNSSSSLNSLAFSSCLRTSCFASSDQFTHENSCILDLSSSGTEKVTDGIYSLPPSSFFNCSTLEAIIFLNISDHLIPGCLSILDFNSFGIDNVTVAIFNPLNDLVYDSVCEHKYVDIYKCFGLNEEGDIGKLKDKNTDNTIQDKRSEGGLSQESVRSQNVYNFDIISKLAEQLGGASCRAIGCKGNLSNFKLEKVAEIYKEIKSGELRIEDLVFLDGSMNEIKVESIEKVGYNGRMYDIDVENDIVLVRRGELVVWSGNSNNGTAVGDAKQVDNGKFGKGFEFDGDGDYVSVAHDSSLNVTGDYSWGAWFYTKMSDSQIPLSKNTGVGGSAQFAQYSIWIYLNDWRCYVGNDTSSNFATTNNDVPGDVNSWVYIMCVYNDSGLHIYKNGVFIDSNDSAINPNTPVTDSNPLYIGVEDGDPGADFNGTIDDVMIFNRSLNAWEIQGLYANTSQKYVSGNYTNPTDDWHTFKGYVQDLGGNVNTTSTTHWIEKGINTGLDAWDLEDDSEDFSAWFASEDEPLPDEMTYFFANYSSDVDGSAVSGANCNISFSGGSEDSGGEFENTGVSSEGLVGLWHFNNDSSYGENDTHVYDFSGGGGNNGTWNGDASPDSDSGFTTSGKLGAGGFMFDGDGDWVNVDFSNSQGSYTSLTVSNWIYWNSGADGRQTMINEMNGASLYWILDYSCDVGSANEKLNLYLGDTSDEGYHCSASTIPRDTWTFVSFTYDNSTSNGSIYINGVIDNSFVTNGSVDLDASIRIGALEDTRDYFPGKIDEVMIFNRSLSASEVMRLYNGSAIYNMSYNSSEELYYYNRTFDYAGNYSWNVSCDKTGYEEMSNASSEGVRIRMPIYNQSSVGLSTNKIWVNYNESLNMSANISSEDIDGGNSGYNVSEVWVQVSMPNSTIDNYSLGSIDGDFDGGIWNLTKDISSGALGDYVVTWYGNLTNGFGVVKTVESNFSVQNTTITITPETTIVNTTDVVNVQGLIRRYNGSDYWNIADNKFAMKINNVYVSSDVYNDSNFTYQGEGVNLSIGDLRLNLSSEGSTVNYTDDFAGCTKYQEDNYSSHNVGCTSGVVFDYDSMSVPRRGNITYKFNSLTEFYNATAYAQIGTGDIGSGNISLWYSYDYSSWTALDSSVSQGALIGGVIPVDGYTEFYVKVEANFVDYAGDNPVTWMQINYSSYDYDSSGYYNSSVINLPNVTYTTLKWVEDLQDSGGDVLVQIRESDDGVSWDNWGSNYSSGVDNDVSSLTKDYIQYRVWLNTSNVSSTPFVSEINISYFNASTNSTGGYSYNVTIPTDNLGVLPLEVSIIDNPTTGIVGANASNITVWVRTNATYSIVRNYTQSLSNYSVWVNFTRTDINNGLVNGSFNVSISNLSDSGSSGAREFENTGVSNTSLVGLWHFNNASSYGENDTYVYDFSGGGNNGTWNGDASPDSDSGFTTSGKLGAGAFMFDGDGDYVETTLMQNDLNAMTNGTVSLWFNADDIEYHSNYNYMDKLFSCHSNEFELMFNSNGNKLEFQIYNSGYYDVLSSTNNFAINTWYHVAVTWGLENMKIYINGNFENNNSYNGTIGSGSGHPFRIGITSTGLYNISAFNGTIDEVMIFNRSLNASEIQDLYNQTFPGHVVLDSQTCTGVSQCVASWQIPADLAYGNYTINVSVWNESAYYINSSNGYEDYLEERNTTGVSSVDDKNIGDFSFGTNYTFLHNFTINNTGNASMLNVYIWDAIGGDGITFEAHSPCARIFPNSTCNYVLNFTIDGSTSAGSYEKTLRANWSDNDGSVSGGASPAYLQEFMTIEIITNATMELNISSQNLSVEHEASGNFSFLVESTGSGTVVTVTMNFTEGNITDGYNLSSSWISYNPSSIASINPGSNSEVTATVSIPAQTAPGNYSGAVNVTAQAGGEQVINLTVEVPTNTSWVFSPTADLTYNRTFQLNEDGEIGNYTINNTGNINMSFSISYVPSRTTDYSAIQGLFSEDNTTHISGLTLNPTSINVSKRNNTLFTVYQFGDDNDWSDIGINITISNASGSPTSGKVQDAWWIVQAPPEVTNIYFILDNIYGNKAEVNRNVTIKIRATDDVNLNRTTTVVNVTYGGTTDVLNASDLFGVFGEYDGGVGSTTVLNYTANFTPSESGVHYVVVQVWDTAASPNSNISLTYNFTSYTTTSIELSQNISSYNISDITRTNAHSFYMNYTLNNTGEVYAYAPNITFSYNASAINITPGNYSFSDMNNGTKDSYEFQINVSELTPSGQYNVTATSQWRNPDNTLGSDAVVLSINVASNKSMSFIPSSLNLSVSSGSSNSTILTINNTGNDALTSVDLNCYTATLCPSFTESFNESDFTIAANSSRQVNISLSAGASLEGGTYLGAINISEQDISDTINIQAVVPESYAWNATPRNFSYSKGSGQAGTLREVSVVNNGNMVLSFNLNSTNSSIIQPNQSSITVPILDNRSFMVNYTAPSVEGLYQEKIMITNSSYTPTQINISVNLTSTAMNVSVLYPISANNISNVTAGQLIEVHTNATYGDDVINSNSTWSVSLDGSSCTNISYNFSESLNYWNLTCYTPSIADGIAHNLTATINHDTYGEVSDTSENSVIYRDVTFPSFNITRNNINISQNINIQFNVTDNIGISDTWIELIYPNGSYYSSNNSTEISMQLSGGLYIYNNITLNDAGEYLVNYSANDTTGNRNSSLDWFEVYDRYIWNVHLLDYDSSAVADVNLSLYRANSTTLLLNNVTNASGHAVLNVNKRFYDLSAKISKEEVVVRNINFSNLSENNISFNLHRIAGGDLDEIIALYEPFIGVASNSSGLDDNSVSVTLNYSGYNYDSPLELAVVKCSSWNYTDRACSGSWSAIASSRDIDNITVTGNSTGFSSYFLAENKCGNGLCEGTYGETTSTCSDDCTTTTSTTTVVSGGGGGGGGLRSGDLAKIEEMVKSFLNIGGVKLETTSIYKELFAGETTTFRISLRNTLTSPTIISLSTSGDITSLIFFESSSIELAPSEERSVLIKVVAPKLIEPGNYDGDLILKSGEEEGSIPVTIKILAPEGKLLDVKIQPLTQRIAPGEVLRLQTDLLNLGKAKKVDVQFDLQLLDVETGEVVARNEEAFAVETTISTIKNLTIPEHVKTGRYMVKAVAYYSNLEQGDMQASSIAYVLVDYPLYSRKFFGIPVWLLFVFFFIVVLLVAGFFYTRYLAFKKKRFKVKVDFNKLPAASTHSAFVGKVAESDVRTFMDLNKLQMHTLIAGSTGSGKTVAAQGIIEEALLRKRGVIVFDPTAQWTGFLRKCIDKGMLKRYKYFNMKERSAKGFEGIIKTISDPYEIINIKKYLNRPGEIIVFNVSHLSPKEIDVVVASSIQQIFRSEPEESKKLKTLIVYDEVHRLLPKFGGSGDGFVQLERGAREFRKWGIGLMLISQVLSDFVGEIKANIGTEVQMGTRYEGDLERVSMKYGEDVLKSVVKEPIGTGMVVNPEFNSGRPYFVAFKPLLHSTKRLSKDELKKYEKYFDEIEDLEYQSAWLKKFGIDTLDLKLEIKLTKAKVKEGQFQMADMYLESLRPRIQEHWAKLGKKPRHRVKKRLSKKAVKAGISKARKEREKYIKKNPQQVVSFGKEILDLKNLIEEKKKKGEDTTNLEIKFKDLKTRLKPFKGKVDSEDSEGIKNELEALKKDINKMGAKNKK